MQKTVRDIASLRIQGAEAVAKAGAEALKKSMHRSRANTAKELLDELKAAARILEQARPTEPCLRNALAFALRNVDSRDIVRLIRSVDNNINLVNKYFKSAEKDIADIGQHKVRGGDVVFTHCHSSTVMMILAQAHFHKKRFSVHNTETRPLYQGRKTAKELSALGIKVHHYIDSAARLALKKCDVFLFGADAVQSDGRIINKIGTELMLETARRYDIPAYCCTVAWKFDPGTIKGPDEPIENRRPAEVWARSPKNVTIMNPAFEIIDPRLVTGIISELGIFRPETFVDEARRAYQWI